MSPKRIVIDGRMIGWTGIGRYTRNLLDHLQQLDQHNQYIVLLQAADYAAWHPMAPNFTKVRANYAPYSLSEQLLLPIKLWRIKADLVHFLHFAVPVLYFRPYVVTIHDLILVHFKNVRGKGTRALLYEIKYWLMRLVLRHGIYASRHILTPSSYVKQDILSSYKPRLPEEKISTILLAAETGGVQPQPSGRKRPFLLYVGNAYPNKNLSSLLQAFAQLKRPDLDLVLVGPDDYFYHQLKAQAAELGLTQQVTFAGRVPEAELIGLYQDATLVTIPSLAEGFGLPVLEAFLRGTPVICSNTTSLPEVGGDAAAYFDPDSPDDMAAKIAALLDDNHELARLALAGPARAKLFSWNKTAKQTLAIYKQLLT